MDFGRKLFTQDKQVKQLQDYGLGRDSFPIVHDQLGHNIAVDEFRKLVETVRKIDKASCRDDDHLCSYTVVAEMVQILCDEAPSIKKRQQGRYCYDLIRRGVPIADISECVTTEEPCYTYGRSREPCSAYNNNTYERF